MNEEGRCPKCGSENLIFMSLERHPREDGTVGYEFICTQCGGCGDEIFKLVYVRSEIAEE